MECMAMREGYFRGFTAAEKTELWDRWQRGESLKAIGRAFGKPSSSIYFQLAPRGNSSCATASLKAGIDARGARGNIQSYCRVSIDAIDSLVTGPLTLDGEPRDQPEWRL